ncbi:dipeptide/oligopeptide/nickel ABC transporter ATP-binding protein [Sporosarcina oncorhynchi]|uniref:Dipeptide/oligopeptide/nickel ABC transporter ATP-binding protein n=1 Tax=Sporosarcina oncorhynchi TaxID=3056444 RepID=A0ABZ0L669_9BACL|nr:dipeptide/oligopeptide/nickel ABC transporter ATP-binding protein [Sporosarcina sp. T2O-4]WOV87433.1 dipeptide/oligopeptide/nickel ABC transporter ATP-binding protein [Sporosarcina sp. T2O-4]
MMLKVEHLSKQYGRGRRKRKVLHDVNLLVGDGELVGIVGESGSGKSTLARLLMRLEKVDEGTITLSSTGDFYASCQIVFQNASAALNPSWTVRESLMEPLRLMNGNREAYICEMLDKVSLSEKHLNRLPSELSGGERQRVNLLRSILVKPKLLICDEIVSSLDRLIQKEIVELLLQLNKEMGMAILFISHDLKVVNYLCDRVYVMEAGRVVEESVKQDGEFVFLHPYSQRMFE